MNPIPTFQSPPPIAKHLKHYSPIKSVTFCKRLTVIFVDRKLPPITPLPPAVKVDMIVYEEGRSIFNGR